MRTEIWHKKYLWNVEKAVLRGKFIVIQTYLKKKTKSEVKNLTSHIEELEEEQMKPQINRKKKIIKIREKINREKNGKDQCNYKWVLREKNGQAISLINQIKKRLKKMTPEMKEEKHQMLSERYNES